MDNFKITDEYRTKLMESAAWSKVGVVLSEARKTTEASSEQLDEAKKKKKDKKWGGKKGDESKSRRDFEESTEEDEGSETLEEEVHVCPLCISQLDEAIDQERLVEHMDVVLSLVERLSSINEDEEDIDQVIDAALNDILLGPLEDEE
jgi:aspartokinase